MEDVAAPGPRAASDRKRDRTNERLIGSPTVGHRPRVQTRCPAPEHHRLHPWAQPTVFDPSADTSVEQRTIRMSLPPPPPGTPVSRMNQPIRFAASLTRSLQVGGRDEAFERGAPVAAKRNVRRAPCRPLPDRNVTAQSTSARVFPSGSQHPPRRCEDVSTATPGAKSPAAAPLIGVALDTRRSPSAERVTKQSCGPDAPRGITDAGRSRRAPRLVSRRDLTGCRPGGTGPRTGAHRVDRVRAARDGRETRRRRLCDAGRPSQGGGHPIEFLRKSAHARRRGGIGGPSHHRSRPPPARDRPAPP